MSIDAGGLAQMTYQSPFNNTIGVSGPGFGSRGKGHHIKRLSVAPPSRISTIDETQQVNTVSTPRTARGHLLAGLRTAPKSATVPSANSTLGLENSRYAPSQYNRVPQTTTAAHFPSNPVNNSNYQNYSLPEHVLAPPALDFQRDNAQGVDQSLYDELVATNNYLAQQQRALQQQLLSVQAAAQQFGGLNLNANLLSNLQNLQSPPVAASPMSIYNQQLQHGLQPIVSPVPGSPGVFAVYNPMTGQSSFFVDNSAQQQQQHPQSQQQQQQQQQVQEPSPVLTNNSVSPPPPSAGYQRQSPQSLTSPNGLRSRSPPKSTPSPQQEVEPLPPPSANAFRRGHKKNISSINVKGGEWNRNSISRPAGIPPTPATGTFGPGQGRAGEHPLRQPRGPPLIQELEEKPTSKHEGSKNFATCQRRRAVHDLVRAGRERTGNRQAGSGSATPASEAEFNFSVSSSDNDDVLARSATLSSKPSLGSLRAVASGAIGSERKNSRERNSVESIGGYSAKSLSSDEGSGIGGNVVEVDNARRNTPLLVLNSAEKRKSFVM